MMARPQIINHWIRLIWAAPCSALALFSLSCGGSVSANANAKVSADSNAQTEANFDAYGDSGWETTEHTLNEDQTNQGAQHRASGAPGAQGEAPLLGARHDLNLGPHAQETCRCLAVALGPADHSLFVWSAGQPQLASNQLAFAFTSNNIACKGSDIGASYMGYEIKDGDVIVKVEAANSGRPITTGAIIPRPAQGKQVYLEPSSGIPYGRGLSGEPRCALGAGAAFN